MTFFELTNNSAGVFKIEEIRRWLWIAHLDAGEYVVGGGEVLVRVLVRVLVTAHEDTLLDHPAPEFVANAYAGWCRYYSSFYNPELRATRYA